MALKAGDKIVNEHYPIESAAWGQSAAAPFATDTTATASATEDAEAEAILTGIFAGEFALEQSRRSGVLQLFIRDAQAPRDDPKLEALRAYAEFRRVFIGKDRLVPTASLLASGYTSAQIVKFDASIVAWPRA